MRRFSFIYLLLILLLPAHKGISQVDSLRFKIEQIAQSAKGTVGVAMLCLEDNDTLTCNGEAHLPMQSVFKFPIALAVLNKVDSGKLSLTQTIHFSKEDMNPDTWSPLREKYPKGNVDISIRELLNYMVSQSDNIACDALIRMLGGPQEVENYLLSIHAKGIAIVATEADMHKAWDIQYKNWCEPVEMAHLLVNFFNGSYLSASSTALLMNMMAENNISAGRIKGLLPKGTIVAHKSGSSDTNEKGITAATNDAGIITLPNGKHLILVVFVSDSKANDTTRDLVIAEIAKTAWDYACNNKSLR